MLQGVYKLKRMDVPQLNLPSFVKHTDVFVAQITLLTKFRSQMKTALVLSVNWQLREVI